MQGAIAFIKRAHRTRNGIDGPLQMGTGRPHVEQLRRHPRLAPARDLDQCASMLSRGFRSDSPARAGAGDGAAARFRSTARVCVTVGTLVWFGNTVTRCGPNVILHGYTSTTSATASLNFRLNSFSSESLPNCR